MLSFIHLDFFHYFFYLSSRTPVVRSATHLIQSHDTYPELNLFERAQHLQWIGDSLDLVHLIFIPLTVKKTVLIIIFLYTGCSIPYHGLWLHSAIVATQHFFFSDITFHLGSVTTLAPNNLVSFFTEITLRNTSGRTSLLFRTTASLVPTDNDVSITVCKRIIDQFILITQIQSFEDLFPSNILKISYIWSRPNLSRQISFVTGRNLAPHW